MIEALVKKAKIGDEEAFSRLVDIHYNEMFLLAMSVVKNPYDAKDVCQESYIKVYKKLKYLKKLKSYKSWLGSIVYNTAKDLYKKNRKVVVVETAALKDFIEDDNDERIDLFSKLLNLKQIYLEVLVLKYFNGLTTKEISKVLLVNENTIKSRIRYALEEMRKMMEVR